MPISSIEKLVFAIAALVSLYFTYVGFYRMARVVLRGQGSLNFEDNPSQRIVAGLVALVWQGGILRSRFFASFFHFLVAWGFLYYLLVNAVDVIDTYIDGFRYLGHSPLGSIYRFIADISSICVLMGIIFLLIRRFWARDSALNFRHNVRLHPKVFQGIPKDSLIVGAFILGHVGSRFLGASFLIAFEGGDNWQPFAGLVANLWSGLSPMAIAAGWHVAWWVALGLVLLFLPYFPYSKHVHLFMGPLNFMTRPRRKALGILDPIDFEDEALDLLGVARLTDLPQTQILDALACIMCNRCQDACPAYVTGKELSPAALEVNKRYYIKEKISWLAGDEEDQQTLLEYAISENALWACTSCGACAESCPVGNQPMLDILGIRRSQVLIHSAFPFQLKAAFTGIERNGNPWAMTGDRLAWVKLLDFSVPTVHENPNFEILYWVGCASAFDPNGQRIAQAIATVLHAAGVNFAVLGNDEACTGDMARRAGNEYLFFEMARRNIEMLNMVGADKRRIVTGCPHCLQTLGREYREYGGHYEVLHHTQLIAQLIGSGRLRINSRTLERATLHDPCYLGRYNGEYDAPREVLIKVGTTLLEMGRNRDNSFCCGAGGAQLWKEEEKGAQAVSANRYAEACATSAETLATSCPFCVNMLNSANNQTGVQMKIKDVAEIVATII